jgi:lysophospholipase L1-like esterase
MKLVNFHFPRHTFLQSMAPLFAQPRAWLRRGFGLLLLLGSIAGAVAQNMAVYTDSLQNSWANWSWGSTINLSYNANTQYVHSGSSSISITITNGWSGLYLEHANISSTPYTNLTFWVNGGPGGGQPLAVEGLLGGTGQANNLYHFTPTSNTWQQITVPLSALGVANAANFDGFYIQAQSASAQPVFYVDDISLAVPVMLSAPNTTISANPASIAANGTSTSTITVQAKDSNGNNLTSSGGVVILSTTLGSLANLTDNGNGTYTAILTSSTVPGTASVTGTIAATDIGHPTSVAFNGVLSAANTTISANPASITADGVSTSTITVQAKDINGYNMPASSGTVTLSTTAGTLGSVTDNGNGTYTAILTAASTTNTATITGTIAGTTIGHPATVSFTLNLAPNEIAQYNLTGSAPLAPSIVASGVTAGNVTLGYAWFWSEVTNGLQMSAGTNTTAADAAAQGLGYYLYFTISSTIPMNLTSMAFNAGYGQFGSPAGWDLKTGVDSFASYVTQSTTTQAPTFAPVTFDLSGPQFQGLTSITFELSGYDAAYASEQMNHLTLNGFLGAPLSPAHTTISANPASITANGTSTSTITVQARDATGAAITSSRGTVTLNTTAGSLGGVTDNGNGTYTAILTSSTTAGTASITGTIAGAVIGNPTPVNFVAGPVNAANTSISPNPASIPANGTSTSTITVQARDAYNNLLTSSGGVVTLNTTAGSLGSVTDNGNGTYTAILTSPTTTGTANITGTIAGATIGLPTSVIFTGALSPANSTISANPTTITADGISTSTIKVQAKDANGVNITVSSGTATLSTTAGSLGGVTDNGNGTYTAILISSTTAGTASITGTIAGVAIGNETSVAFTALISAANTTITASPSSIVANGTNASTITVQGKDANGNNTLTIGTVTLGTTDGSLSSVTNDENGTYTAILTSPTLPGTANITGTINGVAIGHPAVVILTPSPSTLIFTNIHTTPTGVQMAWNPFPGQSYSVLSSSNMVTWATNPVGVANQFLDPSDLTAPEMFYKVKEDINPNPRISINKPTAGYAAAEYQSTSILDDGLFGVTSWYAGNVTPSSPGWMAINLGSGPKRVMLEWNCSGNYNYADPITPTSTPSPDYGSPLDYEIYASSNSTTGADGTWTLVASVTNNTYRTRSHSFDFTGMKWAKMVVTSVPSFTSNGLQLDEIEVYDISEANSRGRIAEDTWFFMGDSITAFWANRYTGTGTNDPNSNQPSFAGWINIYNTNYFPSMINGGIGGETSANALARLPQNLTDNPDYHYWALCYGANDAGGNTSNTGNFQANMQAMITMLLANGRMPVIPHIACIFDGNHNNVPLFNAVIDQLVATNHIMAGPDCYTYFLTNSQDFRSDGLHPNAAGMRAYNLLWAQAMSYLYP